MVHRVVSQDSEPGTNKWGPNLKEIGQARYYNPYQQNNPYRYCSGVFLR